ncbi:uncharacterized protein MELLADRAFT_86601 [Melampsora larici-populina 98AG31]|uniref:Uncharacterized protein n=1 Tax=Melampsora larici-populina (strain 98AG31 / pathotype 3-4-7) TaxID=747676 RepID=F4RME5_MELLP|nr:uncharacterized protein MELLADRAFT_86601 [Melampsora larici-populina 98AG31]EGG06413.1 hypothetical protein MELLADRAFT_86601 [Melampsora larici-populina 98AG31]
MDDAVRQAAQRAAQLTITRSRSVALGQPPGPPLATPHRKTNQNRVSDTLDGEPIQPDEIDQLIDDAAEVLQGPWIDSEEEDDASWAPPAEKGEERAVDNTSPTPSLDRQSTWSQSASFISLHELSSCEGELKAHDPEREETHDPVTRGVLQYRVYALHEPYAEGEQNNPNDRVSYLFNVGRHAEARALLDYITSQVASSVVNDDGERVPVASGSGLARSRPYNLLADELSSASDNVDEAPLIKRTRMDNHPKGHTPDRVTLHQSSGTSFHPQTCTPLNLQALQQPLRPPPVPQTQPQMSRLNPDHGPPQPRQPNSNIPPGQTQEDEIEAEQVKILLATKKGRLVLRNGDVIENGRWLIADESEEMEKGLTPLSPVLTHWLKTFKSYIPLTVFNKYFLIEDQHEWSRRKAPTESKIDEGSAALRAYGGQPPPEELTMQFEDWIDRIALFIKYVAAEVWVTLAERFDGHRKVVMDLRENYGWMVALRYCRLIRQGVMRETVDNQIRNFSKIQSAIFEDARITADSRQERAYRTNPYASGGPLAHLNPLSGLPRPSPSMSTTKKTLYGLDAMKVKTEPGTVDPRGASWIPSAKWRTMTAEEKHEAKRSQSGSSRRREEDRGRDRGSYRDREYYRSDREERGRYRRRSHSRSRSPKGGKGKGRG